MRAPFSQIPKPLTRVASSGLLLAVAFSAACSTVPDPYIPSETGPVRDSQPDQGLQLTIDPISDTFVFGKPVTFRVILENVGDQGYWVPRAPHILFYWVYPTGVRDHYVRERPAPRFLPESDAVLLPPGHRLVYLEHIETFYFPRPGIMDFHAHYISARNLNPNLAPYWTGRLVSNTYGVRLN